MPAIFALPVVVGLLLFRKWRKHGRDPRGREAIIVQHEPPAGLSPIEIGAFLRGSIAPEHISAEIIHLAQRGYVKITPVEGRYGRSYIFTKIKDLPGSEPEFDQAIMWILFRTEEMARAAAEKGKGFKKAVTRRIFKALAAYLEPRISVTLEELKKEKIFSANQFHMGEMVFSSLVRKGYQGTYLGRTTGRYVTIAFAIAWLSIFLFGGYPPLVFSLLATAAVIAFFGLLMSKVTPAGAHMKEYIAGFRSYLAVAEKDRLDFHHAPGAEPDLSGKLVPYAVALGVMDSWAEEFEDMHDRTR